MRLTLLILFLFYICNASSLEIKSWKTSQGSLVMYYNTPEIPMAARRKAITGFVKVRYLINEDGRVERLKVIESKPKGVFESGVLAALGQWTYEPAGYRGESVRVSVVKTFRFN